jgi:hypothetical protein
MKGTVKDGDSFRIMNARLNVNKSDFLRTLRCEFLRSVPSRSSRTFLPPLFLPSLLPHTYCASFTEMIPDSKNLLSSFFLGHYFQVQSHSWCSNKLVRKLQQSSQSNHKLNISTPHQSCRSQPSPQSIINLLLSSHR